MNGLRKPSLINHTHPSAGTATTASWWRRLPPWPCWAPPWTSRRPAPRRPRRLGDAQRRRKGLQKTGTFTMRIRENPWKNWIWPGKKRCNSSNWGIWLNKYKVFHHKCWRFHQEHAPNMISMRRYEESVEFNHKISVCVQTLSVSWYPFLHQDIWSMDVHPHDGPIGIDYWPITLAISAPGRQTKSVGVLQKKLEWNPKRRFDEATQIGVSPTICQWITKSPANFLHLFLSHLGKLEDNHIEFI